MPKKAKPIIDVKAPGDRRPSATSRPIIVGDHSMSVSDPMVVADEESTAQDTPKTAPVVSRTAKTLQPMHDISQPGGDTDTDLASEAATVAPEVKQPDEPAAEAKPAQAALDTPSEESEEIAPLKEAAPGKQTAPLADEKAAAEASPETPADSPAAEATETEPKSPAKDDAEAAKAQAAEEQRLADLQKLIDSRQFFVPVNAVEQKRSIRASLWLTLLVIALAIVLIDFMLDANVIELLTKLPHTHFFAPQSHF